MAFLCRLNLSKQNKQVVELYISTFVGTLLGVVSSIINTRFLDPVNYGDVRYVQNIINLIAALLLFGYFLSGSRLLALSNDEAYSRRIRGAMVVILLIASLILIIGTASNYWIHLYNGKLTVAPLFIISLPVCIHQLLLNYVNTTAQGDNHIGRLSVARMLPALLYIPLAYWIYTQFGATSTRMILLQWGTSSLILIGVIVHLRRAKSLRIHKDLQVLGTPLRQAHVQQYGLLPDPALPVVPPVLLAGIGLLVEPDIEIGTQKTFVRGLAHVFLEISRSDTLLAGRQLVGVDLHLLQQVLTFGDFACDAACGADQAQHGGNEYTTGPPHPSVSC